ncbi:MAG: formate acetyltransferase [Candidatus Solincola sediminis]|uniref:Formate acetyltransferase n=1 Tax=Candidatus Solincola sediminis TaxID=1797199 RepID=A0A1F2WTS7_9ACTN|nr:MAG: formate acetyltransferase [Candidatus Solincola sediminis]OFW60851.1 MAG: formate acetyltransferase [Candidatus Solincola sediminis]
MSGISKNNILAGVVLRLMAANFNHRSSLKEYLKGNGSWFDFGIGFRSEDGHIERAMIVKDGKLKVKRRIPSNIDASMILSNDKVLMDILKAPPNELMNMLLKSKYRVEGNLSYLTLFNFYIAQLTGKRTKKVVEKVKEEDKAERLRQAPHLDPRLKEEMARRRGERMRGEKVDSGVKYLKDPYLSQFRLEEFPRLQKFLDIHFTTMPEICHERPKLLTDWFMENGFEIDKQGEPWFPELRQGHAFKYLMENREPILRKDDLIAGTTTAKEIGVVIYPDTHGTLIWSELLSTADRELFPYKTSKETLEVLHHDVFPFWIKRNCREWVRERYNQPLSQKLDERFAVYFMWKTAALSHTIADFPKLLKLGTKGFIAEIEEELVKDASAGREKQKTLEAMILCLEGIATYARNLSKEAARLAEAEENESRKKELEKLAETCAKVPENPAETVDEAVNAIWIVWVGLHMENTNAGLSLGRMDQWLQPYFEADILPLRKKKEREEYIKHVIELIGCFYMRCTDHLPLIPDIGNYLFGGSSSDQVITLGGVTPEGKDAVNDMTYIFLKVTELLNIRDPNVNARFSPEVSSDTYLKRLCEVNLITAATPSMHNDQAVMDSLAEFNYPIEDLRDWSATGCVEPTLCGKHIGHTNCMMMNMVAALEMALNNGKHPLMNWEVGPKTGSIEKEEFAGFEDFLQAFETQFKFLIDNSVAYNNMLGEAHSVLRPTPLLSAMISNCIEKGVDVTKGGAKYNSSGAACIGLADITDSLMAIKKLVYDDKRISFKQLKRAIDTNFQNDSVLHATITNKVPFFGSGNDEAVEMATRVARFAHDTFGEHLNFRGGKYTSGFWSMSNHVAFGTLTGALPSGRFAGKAFTPGLTPQAGASKNLLDNIRDVARLDPRNMNNNIAFNIKVVPGAHDSHERIVESMYAYAKTYFELGGMQMQMNVVTSDLLRDAMAHPEDYRNLLVRISGYNAYFVTLNRDLQMELIERAEYRI